MGGGCPSREAILQPRGRGVRRRWGMNLGGGAPKAFPVEVEAWEEEGDTKV